MHRKQAFLTAFLLSAGLCQAGIISYSGNPLIPAGPVMYPEKCCFGSGDPITTPFLIEYGALAARLGPGDLVRFAIALNMETYLGPVLTRDDMIYEQVDGVWDYYFPEVWYQAWAPGVSTAGAPTWEHVGHETLGAGGPILTWALLEPFIDHTAGMHLYNSDTGLWTLAGGFQEGAWSFRISLKSPHSWITAMPDGTFSDPWTDSATAPLSGRASASATPEPSSLLFGVTGLGGVLLLLRVRRRQERLKP